MKLTPNFYRDRVCLNVLAGSKANASAIYEAAEGHVLVGVLSKNYPDVDSAVADMREYAALIDNALSVGLGAGDPNQSAMVSEISRQVQPQHVNQVFTGVATSRALLGQNDSVVNGLVSPTGTVGMVKISTGPLSSKAPDGIVPVETAIALLKDFGGSSIKYFPMGGLACRDEYKAVAEACAKHGFLAGADGRYRSGERRGDPADRAGCGRQQDYSAHLQLNYRQNQRRYPPGRCPHAAGYHEEVS